jgi:hypothetical protein
MNPKFTLPPALQEAAETSLSMLQIGNQNPECLNSIYAWLGVDGDGWEHLISDSDERFAIWLSEIADNFTDSAVRENLGLDDSTALDDHDRTRWGRRYVDHSLQESDRLVSLSTFQIHGKDGASAYIGCLMTAEWPEGPACQWQGLWLTRESFLESVIEKYGLWLVPDGEKVTDDAILELWQTSRKTE